MRSNHLPATERLRNRIWKLERKADEYHVKSPHRGNPYWCCKSCGIHDPALSVARGRHFKGCEVAGLAGEITHYKKLLVDQEHSGP